MITRIYLVKDESSCYLVRAATRVQALNHVTRDRFRVTVATQENLVKLLASGRRVENVAELNLAWTRAQEAHDET